MPSASTTKQMLPLVFPTIKLRRIKEEITNYYVTTTTIMTTIISTIYK